MGVYRRDAKGGNSSLKFHRKGAGNSIDTPQSERKVSQRESDAPQKGCVRMADLIEINASRLSDIERNLALKKLSSNPHTINGVKNRSKLSFYEEMIGLLMFLFFPGCVIWCPVLMPVIAAFCFKKSLESAFVYLLVLALLTFFPHSKTSHFGNSPIFAILFKYTSLSYAWEAPLDKKKSPYMFVCPPHGVLPVSNLLFLIGLPHIWGFEFHGLTTDAALRLPILRQIMLWVGCKPATRKSAKKILESGMSIGISPGGVSEIFDTNNNDEVIFIKERKGFVKLALMTGTPIVPSYCFGTTKLFSCWYGQGDFLRKLSRKVGFGVVLVWGRFGLPIIHRYPLTTVSGAPIFVPLEKQPSQKMIDEYHLLFLTELKGLFDRNKAAYGWADKELVIR